jgi:hypothetical protein
VGTDIVLHIGNEPCADALPMHWRIYRYRTEIPHIRHTPLIVMTRTTCQPCSGKPVRFVFVSLWYAIFEYLYSSSLIFVNIMPIYLSVWLNFVAKLVNSDKFPWILRNFNFRKNMYVICMLYVWATYNMAQSLCTRVFAPCHVIRLYVFAKFIKISYRQKGIQLPTEAHFPTD